MIGSTRRRLLSEQPPLESSEPDVTPSQRSVVQRALRWAWGEVCRTWPNVVRRGSEEDITEKVEQVLNEQDANNRRRAPGFGLYDAVVRGGKVKAADGRNQKAPDLVLRPPRAKGVRNRSHWGIFVECKIVDGGKSYASYCENGLCRFVDGEYCARMRSGAMLAYVRDGARPFGTLDPRLHRRFETVWHRRGADADTSYSMHSRGTLVVPCVDILLTHLWLDCI